MILEQRVSASEIYVRFAGGREFRKTGTELRRAIQRGATRSTLEAQCITELRALVGSIADEFDIELAADGTPLRLNWCDPAMRSALADAGQVRTR